MAVKRLSADTLIELAAATIRSELLPGLSPDKRYTAAMVLNALEIARREVIEDDQAAQWGLLDRLYDDGEGTTAQLARDIRSGAVTNRAAEKGIDLPAELRKILVAELRIRNPRFLSERKGAEVDT